MNRVQVQDSELIFAQKGCDNRKVQDQCVVHNFLLTLKKLFWQRYYY